MAGRGLQHYAADGARAQPRMARRGHVRMRRCKGDSFPFNDKGARVGWVGARAWRAVAVVRVGSSVWLRLCAGCVGTGFPGSVGYERFLGRARTSERRRGNPIATTLLAKAQGLTEVLLPCQSSGCATRRLCGETCAKQTLHYTRRPRGCSCVLV